MKSKQHTGLQTERWRAGRRHCFALLCLTAGCMGSAHSQTVPQTGKQSLGVKAFHAGLQKTVHLGPGFATLPQITAALSTQTGLRIEAADYLRERRMLTQMDGISAQEALEAICALHDWAWSHQDDGAILIARHLPLLRQEPGTIPTRMKAALPKDIRAYCRLDTSRTAKNEKPSEEDFMKNLLEAARAMQGSLAARQHLVETLKPGLFSGTAFPYARLAPPLQQDLLLSLLFEPVQGCESLLQDNPPAYIAAPMRAHLELKANTLSVMAQQDADTKVGFGLEIKP